MCSKSSEHDSRGPGWYCHVENRYNDMKRTTCINCGAVRCKELKE